MAKLKVVISGCNGQLGREFMTIFPGHYDVVGFDIDTVDITHADAIREYLEKRRPDVVVHTAACTDVDGCEKNVETAMLANESGTRNIASACNDIRSRMIYFSTDYVFDGLSDKAYTEDDKPNPQTVYGRSKLAGENALTDTLDDYVILRIAWLYGANGKNFVKTMLGIGVGQLKDKKAGKDIRPIRVVDDQIGNPTWTADIVRQTAIVIDRSLNGLYHSTSDGDCSWYRFARDIFDLIDMPVLIEPCTTDEFPRPAPRPRRSTLENSRLKQAGANIMRNYHAALEDFFKQYRQTIKGKK